MGCAAHLGSHTRRPPTVWGAHPAGVGSRHAQHPRAHHRRVRPAHTPTAHASSACGPCRAHTHSGRAHALCSHMTAVGFEPTPFRNGALSHRLRPLGQTVLKLYPSASNFNKENMSKIRDSHRTWVANAEWRCAITYHSTVAILAQGTFWAVAHAAGLFSPCADGHTALNTPDLFRPPKLSGAGPG